MKTMSAKEAKNSFGVFLDSAQREPVVVTKRDRPVGVMFSMNDVPAMIDFADSMREKIGAGIQAGLDDVNAGRVHEANDEFIGDMQAELQKRINANNKA